MKQLIANLMKVQLELKVPKTASGRFGKCRNAEMILEQAKPLCVKYGLLLTLSERMELLGERYYIVSTAKVTNLTDKNEKCSFETEGWAREQDKKPGTDDPQITGTSVSYARKYALQGLFAIDDSSDDPDMHGQQSEPQQHKQKTQSKQQSNSKQQDSKKPVLNAKQQQFVTNVKKYVHDTYAVTMKYDDEKLISAITEAKSASCKTVDQVGSYIFETIGVTTVGTEVKA